LPLTLPLTLGSEVSGAVEKVGAKTTGFAVGDEVFGATNPRFIDGYVEYAVAAARMIAPKPRELSHIEAASVPVVAVTAWQMLFDREFCRIRRVRHTPCRGKTRCLLGEHSGGSGVR
jgi:NADPH:quinone reductase-like Zn-dependent oxidoreductase